MRTPKGLTTNEAEKSRELHGANVLTEIPPDPLWKKILQGFLDPMIMILCVALLIQVVLWIMGESHWYESVAILVAILIANGVSAVSEKKQEGKASALKHEEEAKELAKVVRDGATRELHVTEVVAGDMVYLQAGDKVPADGEIRIGSVKLDQAALNGETEEAGKHPREDVDEKGILKGEKPEDPLFGLPVPMSEEEKSLPYSKKDLLNAHYVYRGTVVTQGEAYMKVVEVGDKTLFGQLALEVQENQRKTPLQVKLEKLAKQISTFGYIGAIAIILSIILKTVLTGHAPADFISWVKLCIEAITVAVTIIVCAVPEGLPMLTSILLSFQSLRMAKDNVLVHKINGLETSGSLSLLYSDKTGTITEGRLSVVEIATGDLRSFTGMDGMPENLKMDLVAGTGLNNASIMSDGKAIGGNSTDRALLSFLMNEKRDLLLDKDEIETFSAFDSTKKCSSVTIKSDGKSVSFVKGAPERLVARCQKAMNADGEIVPLEEGMREDIMRHIDEQSARSMRLLAVAKTHGDPETADDLVLVAIISIRDNVRKEAVDAIKEVTNAGVQVVMVTGDRKETASAIAKEAGLLSRESDVAITSEELEKMDDAELKRIIPDLRVVARALPTDKSRLVNAAQELDLVVGMTGDGVNDSAALKKADVGFAMGSGTEVAKEAGDITILDDNFKSIDKAILYGRTMFKSIRKFLIFQLTVNVAAVLTCFLGPLMGENVVLTVIQLLLINLAMDTLAAIAFGSEPALKEYMREAPIPRNEGIVTKDMFVQIMVGSLYITAVCLGILFFEPLRSLFGDVDTTYLKSAVFATFMMAITFNGFNARTTHLNPFEGIGRNPNFIIVMGSIFVMQFLVVTFGGKVLATESLSLSTWLICLALAFMVIPIDIARKIIVGRKKDAGKAKGEPRRA